MHFSFWILAMGALARAEHTDGKRLVPGHDAPPAARVVCDKYVPGQSGARADEYWKAKALYGKATGITDDPAERERVYTQWLAASRAYHQRADAELTPALLDLFTSPDTLRYYGGFSQEYSKDGRTGLNLVLLRKFKDKEGADLPVAAIVSLDWDPKTFTLRVKDGPDAIRVHSALKAGTPADRGDIGLAYTIDREGKPTIGDYIQPPHPKTGSVVKEGIPNQAAATTHCMSCHAGEGGMTHHSIPPEGPLKTAADYEKYLPTALGPKLFLGALEEAAGKSLNPAQAKQATDRAREALKNPRALVPKAWLDGLKARCQHLKDAAK